MDLIRIRVEHRLSLAWERIRIIPAKSYLQFASIGIGAVNVALVGSSYWSDRVAEVGFLIMIICALVGSIIIGVGAVIGMKSNDDDKQRQIVFAWHAFVSIFLPIGTVFMIVSYVREKHFWYIPMDRDEWNMKRVFGIVFGILNAIVYGFLSVIFYKELPDVTVMVEASRERARKSIVYPTDVYSMN